MKTNDFTAGSVSKQMWSFFLPMLIANILQQAYSFADMVIIGKGIGDNALAAVGCFSTAAFFVTGFMMGITHGFSVNISQAWGAGDGEALRRVFACCIKLTAVFTAAFTAVGIIFLEPAMRLMKTDSLLMDDCLEYGSIIFGGLFTLAAYNMCSSVLRASGDSKTPLAAVIAASVVNILLNLVTVYLLDMGVSGPAYATVISQALSAVICIVGLIGKSELRLVRSDFSGGGAIYVQLIKNGVPMALMNSVTSAGCIFVQSCINGCGVVYAAAYSACSKYINLLMLPGITAGQSVSVFTGQNYGAQCFVRIKEGVKTGCIIAAVFVAVLGAVMLCIPNILAGLMLNGGEAVSYAADFLKIFAFTLIFLNLLFVFRNAVQGMGKPFLPMVSGIAEMLIRIPVIFFGLPILGFRATIFAETAAWVGALTVNLGAYLFIVRRKD